MRRFPVRQLMFLAAFAAAARAAETKAPSQSVPAPAAASRENSIDATKRDFDLIKASRDGANQSEATLPRVTVPDFSPTPAAGAWLPAKPGVPEKKSANWLVDAMEKKPDSRKASGKVGDVRLRVEEGRELEPNTDREREPVRRENEPVKDEPGRREELVVNPLTRFMADWMTPQDLALMKPVMEARAGGEFSGTTRTGAAVSVAEFVLPVSGESALSGSGGSERSIPSSAPRENPYLQAMAPPAQTALPVVASAPGVPFAVEPRALAPLPAPPPPRTSIPDFAKPLSDEKYFKQLKRF